MDINELVSRVSANSAYSKDFVRHIVGKIADEIIKTVTKGERVQIRGFGTFRSYKLAQRVRRMPKTGVKVQFPATTSVKFRPSVNFRESVAVKRKPVGS